MGWSGYYTESSKGWGGPKPTAEAWAAAVKAIDDAEGTS